MMPRRAFLGHLARLPLIGGGVAILGQPTACAEPVTHELLVEYNDWLGWERSRLCREIYGEDGHLYEGLHSFMTRAYDWHRGPRPKPPGDRLYNSPRPSTRAALVLSAVGCDWRQPADDEVGS